MHSATLGIKNVHSIDKENLILGIGAGLGMSALSVLYDLYQTAIRKKKISLKKLISRAALGGITTGGLVYFITNAHTNKEIREAEDELGKRETAFDSSKAIYSKLLHHNQVDIIKPCMWSYDCHYRKEALAPLFNETADTLKERYPIDEDLLSGIRHDKQVNNEVKCQRLKRLEDILRCFDGVIRKVDAKNKKYDFVPDRAYEQIRVITQSIWDEERREQEHKAQAQEERDHELRAMTAAEARKDPATHQAKVNFILKQKNHYEVLGIAEDASCEDILKAFRPLSMLTHPDQNKRIENAEATFKKISEAKTVLTDEEKRYRYNLELKQERNAEPFSDDFEDLLAELRRAARTYRENHSSHFSSGF